jgi:hypothetical protein
MSDTNAEPSDDAPWPLEGSGYGRPAPLTPAGQTDTLAQAVDFSPEMLAANRAGQLAEGQISDLKDSLTAILWRGLITSGVYLLFVGVSSQLPYVKTRRGWVYVGVGGWRSIVALLLLLVIIAVSFYPAILKWADIRSGRATRAVGVVTKRQRKAGTSFVVGNLEFRVSPAVYAALQDGDSYQVYYTPYSKTLLSIEPASTAA